jgi:hypothetical protein
MKRSWLWAVPLAILAIAAGFVSFSASQAVAQQKNSQKKASAKPDEAAVERARKNVRMLDDIYKQVIVLITDKYVNDEKDFPAGSAAVALFANLSKSEHQKVRLIDATGEPYEPENVAKADFEKEGIKKLKAGADFYEQVVENNGKWELRAVTPVPVVMKKCVMCHPHYADAKKGEPIGAISYIVPIE